MASTSAVLGLLVEIPKHPVVQFIPPCAAQPWHNIAENNFALHNNWRYNAKGAQPAALDEPRQRLVDRSRVGKWWMAQMCNDAPSTNARQKICMGALGRTSRIQP